MPKKAIWNNSYYQNIFLLVLVILTTGCYLLCDNVKENITMEQPVKKKKVKKVKKETEETDETDENKKEKFLDWSMYNPPIVNGYTPQWWNKVRLGAESHDLYQKANPFDVRVQQDGYPPSGPNPDAMYNPLGYPNRSHAFYNQGVYPNMALPPQVIGCGGRRGPCLGGTQETISVISSPIEISERNIAPVNIISRALDPNAVGVTQQVGVLYKIFGTLNEIFPLYGVRRYRNSDTWDYFTKVGKEGNFVTLKVLTKRVNNNELQTNDIVILDGNTSRFTVTMYDNNFPSYVPYFKG
jgi:hypothetical protein